MARAKRTQRAEARRRYRATVPDADIEGPEDETPTSGASRTKAPPATKPGGSTVRMGFMDAMRSSIRPIHVREDIAAVPWIALHTKALWLPLLITVASTVILIATQGGTVGQFLFAYFIQTPAIGGVFIAGFLAPRASWLLGVIVGFFSALCYSLIVLVFPLTAGVAVPPTPDWARDVAVSALILSPVIGGFFAAGAAWYRRFLSLTNPNRGRRQSQAPKQRPGDGRTRGGSTSQKAGAKR